MHPIVPKFDPPLEQATTSESGTDEAFYVQEALEISIKIPQFQLLL